MTKKLLFYFVLFWIVVGTVYWYGMEFYAAREDLVWEQDSSAAFAPIEPVAVPKVEQTPASRNESPVEIRTVQVADVPFAVQAPNGDWSNPIYQDACEETSITMVAYALEKKSLTAAIAQSEILALADYGEETFGHYIDTSAADTARMLKDYYGIDSEVVTKPSKDELKAALVRGALVIVPADGRKLGNPNFTPPGPINHMLVVTGYDMETREFVTNDPGTRAGRDYRYDEDVLYAAIRDYPTGRHLPNPAPEKAMIVVPIPE